MSDRLRALREEADDAERLTVQEYADRFRKNVQTVYLAIRENRLPYPVIRPTGSRSILILVPRDIETQTNTNNR